MDLSSPLAPSTTITAAQHQEAVRLFGNGDGRRHQHDSKRLGPNRCAREHNCPNSLWRVAA